MLNSLQMALCDTQGQLFELVAERGYASEAFVKAYMTSAVAADMDKEFHHIQWAGKAYILSRMEKELANARKQLDGQTAKLANENFVSRAPEKVVNAEREKKAKLEALIENLEDSLKNLG